MGDKWGWREWRIGKREIRVRKNKQNNGDGWMDGDGYPK